MSDFAVQKPMRTISLGFGSSSEAVVKQDRLTDLNIAFRYSKKPSQNKRFVCKHRAVSLSLSLSLSLSTFTTCYQSLQTVWVLKIVRRAWSGANMHTKSNNLVRLCVRWKEHFRQVPSFRCMPWADPEGGGTGGGGVRTPLKNHKKYRVSSNIDPDPLKITKLPSQHSMMGHYRQWWSIFSGISVLYHYPLWLNILDQRMHAVRVNRLDWN